MILSFLAAVFVGPFFLEGEKLKDVGERSFIAEVLLFNLFMVSITVLIIGFVKKEMTFEVTEEEILSSKDLENLEKLLDENIKKSKESHMNGNSKESLISVPTAFLTLVTEEQHADNKSK